MRCWVLHVPANVSAMLILEQRAGDRDHTEKKKKKN